MKHIILIAILSIIFFSPEMMGKSKSTKKGIEDIRQYRITHEQAIIKEFCDLLSIPNVAEDKENILKNTVFIKQMMEKRGFEVQILETPGNPVIIGELDVKKSRNTLLFYIHYDGQPVTPSQWTDSEPFKPVLRPGKLEAGASVPQPIPFPVGDEKYNDDWRIYARSTGDDKAPIIALLTAIDAIRSRGMTLKNNIKVILDGEEENGSPNLPYALDKYKNLLKADILFMCDGPTYYNGEPTLFLGARGITSLSITVYGPNTSLHSGHYGNWAPNPAMKLSQLLSSMKDKDGNILVKGFYDSCIPLSEKEQEAVNAIPPYDEEIKNLYGFSGTDGNHKLLMKSILLPSLNINSFHSGNSGKQMSTIIPSTATATIDIRLVKGNDPASMVQRVIDHVASQGFHVVTNEPDQETRMKYSYIAKITAEEKGYRASRTPIDTPVVQRIINALSESSGFRPVLIPSLGGSLPIYVFEDYLHIIAVGLPIANHDNNQHQQNENIRVGHLWRAVETFAAVTLMD